MKKRKKITCPLTPAWSSIPTAAYFRQGCLWLPFSRTQLETFSLEASASKNLP